MSDETSVFVVFRKKDGRFVGHTIAFERPTKDTLEHIAATGSSRTETPATPPPASSQFLSAIRSYVSIMETYRNMIPFTLEMSPLVSGVMASSEIGDFVKERGAEIIELSTEAHSVFQVPTGYLSPLIQRHEAAIAAVKGAEHLPEIAVIGLVSVYDAYLGKLLKVIFSLHEEMVLTSDREIKYSDLLMFDSIEQARSSLIDKEVETVLRNSHHDHFAWMENRFGIKLREGLTAWPDFIEVCERRNLFTHTGGIVSQQYLSVCKKHGYKSDKSVGDKLAADPEYFKSSVKTISEIGIKLGHVLWRKFQETERGEADGALNELGLSLIVEREYALAERILELGIKFKKHSSDEVRRMMIINLANAVRLQGNLERAKKILDDEDWSATGPNFKICVSATREDVSEVCRLMKSGSENGPIKAEQYREWPVFRGMRTNEDFASAFLETFGEPVFRDKNAVSAGASSLISPPESDDGTVH
jgi:hypothetical protein